MGCPGRPLPRMHRPPQLKSMLKGQPQGPFQKASPPHPVTLPFSCLIVFRASLSLLPNMEYVLVELPDSPGKGSEIGPWGQQASEQLEPEDLRLLFLSTKRLKAGRSLAHGRSCRGRHTPRNTPPPKLDFSPTSQHIPRPPPKISVSLSGRAAPTQRNSSEATSGRKDSSPEGPLSPPSAVPQALHFSPEERDLSFAKNVSTEVALGAAQPPGDTAASEVPVSPRVTQQT